jgi:hypothetical protein
MGNANNIGISFFMFYILRKFKCIKISALHFQCSKNLVSYLFLPYLI